MCDKGAIHSMRFDVLYIGRRNKFFYLIPKLATRCPKSSKIICICPTLCIDGAIRARKNMDSADLPIQFYFLIYVVEIWEQNYIFLGLVNNFPLAY